MSDASKHLARALFVEDSAAEIRLITELLNRAHVQFDGHWVVNGEDAMHFLRRDTGFEAAPRPDIIFLDLNLPRVSGEDVLTEIRGDKDLAGIPVVILSGSDFEDDVINAREQGVVHYLVKPLNFEKLQEVVARVSSLTLNREGDEVLLCAA
jgi:DNA-binding response OmpR family regulator